MRGREQEEGRYSFYTTVADSPLVLVLLPSYSLFNPAAEFKAIVCLSVRSVGPLVSLSASLLLLQLTLLLCFGGSFASTKVVL